MVIGMSNEPHAGPAPGGADTEGLYQRRWQCIMDCVTLRQPEYMPVGLFATFWYARYGRMTVREQMYDTGRARGVVERVCLDMQPDLYTPVMMTASFGRPMEAVEFKQLQWPGHGTGDNQPFQYLDREYMSAAEYDDFLFDPTGFYLAKYLPRVAGSYAGLEPIGTLTGSFYLGTCFAAAAFADPRIGAAVSRLTEASAVMLAHAGEARELDRRMRRLGFPASFGAVSMAPYDIVADYFRGATGMMKDLRRHPDKLLQVLDKMATLVIRDTLRMASGSTNPIVFIPIHWAPDPFMSQQQFATFWWPSYAKVVAALIAAGLIPMTMWESDCSKRLEFLRAHTPPGKCIHWFERTDMVRAFEVLGDIVALRGGLSGSLLTKGSPAEVDAEVRRLAEQVFHKGGRLILDGAFGVPDETPVENIRAMCQAARRYAA
ncbi:MAG: hypothetical protein IT368_17935 [Candidatus Hydrogenedentes bacterium]|nr:hypothetical protein [Candidatus Hydrogenedentota bacterium]